MKIKAQKNTNDRIITVGNRGTAFSLAPKDAFPLGEDVTPRFPSPSSAGIDFVTMGQLHGQGKACGIAPYDACLFVSSGAPARLYKLGDALKAGHVKPVDVTIDGTPATVYVAKGWATGHKLPKFMAVGTKCGRVETRLVLPDKRNESYVGKVRLALVSTPTPTPPKGTKGTTPAPTPTTPTKGKGTKGAKGTPTPPKGTKAPTTPTPVKGTKGAKGSK